MENYNKKLDELFNRWENQSKQDGYDGFVYDGLFCKGEKETYWRAEGNENELWENAPKRVLFFLKDMNKDAGEDVRHWVIGDKDGVTQNLFYKNLQYWLYGLLNVDSNGNVPDFEKLDVKVVADFFDKTPFAYVNGKKEAGGSSVSNDVLSEHFYKYKDFIKEEFDILQPDIIVCGGGSGLLKDFVLNEIYNSEYEKINNWIYYIKELNKVVIDSYHPSYWQIEGGSQTIYEGMMEAYKEFLKKYPAFLEDKRKTCEAVRAGLNTNNNMGIFKKNALEMVTKELQAEFGRKLQVKNCEYEDGRNYLQFWFEPYDKWIEVWDGDNLELWLASKEKSDEGFEAGGFSFSNRVWNNSGKYHWYKAEEHFAYDPKNETEVSALVADAIAVLNDLITYKG